MPYCPRCGTALSSHELGQPDVYRDEEDESAYVRLRLVDPVPEARGRRRVAGGVDDHAVDAAVQHRRGGQPRPRLCGRGRDAGGRRAGGRRLRGGRGGPGHGAGARCRAGRPALRAPLRRPFPPTRGRRLAGGPGFVRDHRGGHRPRPPGPGLRRGRPPDRPRQRPPVVEPGGARRALHRRRVLAGGPGRAGGEPRHQRPAGVLRAPHTTLALRALVPALLALPHAPHLLGQAELVHRDVDPQGRPAGGERDGGLAPGAHQGGALRGVAGQQRRLGPVA